jgi:hypothetical protein
MNRLRDRADPLSSTEAEAIALLRSIQPYRPAAGIKQRVRMRIVSRERTKQVAFFRPAVVVALVLLAAGASAAVGGALVMSRSRATSAAGSEAAKAVLLPQLRVPRAISDHDLSASATVPPVSSDDLPLVLQVELPSRQSVRPRSVDASQTAIEASDPVKTSRTAKSAENVKQAEDVKLVFDAMRALRRDGRADVASRQLEEYLRRFPSGTLAEEALALSIEAASVRGDPRAKHLANRYLALYPSGRFQKAAERVRARFSQ